MSIDNICILTVGWIAYLRNLKSEYILDNLHFLTKDMLNLKRYYLMYLKYETIQSRFCHRIPC